MSAASEGWQRNISAIIKATRSSVEGVRFWIHHQVQKISAGSSMSASAAGTSPFTKSR